MNSCYETAGNSYGIELQTGCRLHFGLMELAEGAEHQFAGLGVILDQPRIRLRLRLSPPNRLVEVQPSSHRASSIVTRTRSQEKPSVDGFHEYQQRIESWLRKATGVVSIEVLEDYPFHSGLGTGTQLACLLAIVGLLTDNARLIDSSWRSVSYFYPELQPETLARLTGRGKRSAIGVHGFLNGGFIVDSGNLPWDSGGRPDRTSSVMLPTEWRFVLIRPKMSSGVTGDQERRLINAVSSHPNPSRTLMWELAGKVRDAASSSNFSVFASALEFYLEEANRLFAPVQGGMPYNGPECLRAAKLAKETGLRAVGQSSWGPTIFGLAPCPQDAQRAIDLISFNQPDWYVHAASAATHGACMKRID